MACSPISFPSCVNSQLEKPSTSWCWTGGRRRLISSGPCASTCSFPFSALPSGSRGAAEGQATAPSRRPSGSIGCLAASRFLGASTMFRLIPHLLDCIFDPWALCSDRRQDHFITLCCGSKPRGFVSASARRCAFGVPFVGPGCHHLSFCRKPGLNCGGRVSGGSGSETFPWLGSSGLLLGPCGIWGARLAQSRLLLDTPH